MKDPKYMSRKEQDKYDLEMNLRFGRITKEEFDKKIKELDELTNENN